MPNEDTQAQAPPVTDDEASLEVTRADLIEREKARQQERLVQFQCSEKGDRAGCAVARAKITELEGQLSDLLLLIEGPFGKPELGLERRAARAKHARLQANLAAAIQRQAEQGVKIRAQQKVVEAAEANVVSEQRKLQSLNVGAGVYEAGVHLKQHEALYRDLDFTTEAK